MNDKTTFALAAACCLLWSACFGTETGNPPLTAELTVDAHSSDPARVAIDVDASEAVVEEAWVVVGDVAFVGDDGCDAPAEVMPQLVGLGARDHAGPEPARTSFETTARDFCSVAVELELAETLPAGAPPELDGASVVLRGRRGDGTPFTLVSAAPTTIDVRSLGDRFRIDETRDGLFLGFDVAAWLDGVDLSTGTPAMDGRVHVNATEHPELLAAFEANLSRGVELYRDDDLDGVPDAPTPLARGE